MIDSTTYRGDLPDNENAVSTHELSTEDWIGEIVKIPHPASGHMGSSMGKVIDTTSITKKRRKRPSFEHNPGELDEDAYEEYECILLDIENIITGGIHRTHQSGPPQAAFVEDGSTYSVYGIQHKTGADEWVTTASNHHGNLWGHNQFAIEATRQNYVEHGHEETRVVERSVTYHRDEGSEPQDTEAYTLTHDITPINVEYDP